MCIYYMERTDLTYQKQEHIFPAGLGGIAMLPKGFVSDQANELFSPLEAKLMHDSLISTTRALFGPGKRGSLDPEKSSISKISVARNTEGKLALGYFSGKSSHYINCLYKNNNTVIFTVASKAHDDPGAAWESFKAEIKSFGTRFVRVPADDLDPNDWLFGSYEGKYYLAMGAQCTLDSVKKQLVFFADSAKKGEMNRQTDHPEFSLRLEESDVTGRVYAKVAINVLAALKGEEYIRSSRFSPIKKWILGETKDDVYTQLPRITLKNVLHLPEDCHWCIFKIIDGKLYVVACFYNTYSRCFELTDTVVPEDYRGTGPMFGMICDWKNRRELTLEQWILACAKQESGALDP